MKTFSQALTILAFAFALPSARASDFAMTPFITSADGNLAIVEVAGVNGVKFRLCTSFAWMARPIGADSAVQCRRLGVPVPNTAEARAFLRRAFAAQTLRILEREEKGAGKVGMTAQSMQILSVGLLAQYLFVPKVFGPGAKRVMHRPGFLLSTLGWVTAASLTTGYLNTQRKARAARMHHYVSRTAPELKSIQTWALAPDVDAKWVMNILAEAMTRATEITTER